MAAKRHIDFPYAEGFEAAADALLGSDSMGAKWLTARRRDAIEALRETGLPTPRVEDWKYTNLNKVAEADWRTALPANEDSKAIELPDSALLPSESVAHRLVFVDGVLAPDLSTAPDDGQGGWDFVPLTADNMASSGDVIEAHLGSLVPVNGNPVANLNTAFLTSGVVIRQIAEIRRRHPVHLVFYSTGDAKGLATHPRIVVVLGENSELTLVESHIGAEGAEILSNPVVEADLSDGAVLHHYKVQSEARGSTHLAFTQARLGAKARYDSFVMSLGAALSRNEIHVTMAGEEADCRLNGGYMIGGSQHTDTTTIVDHAVPNCTSHETYKGVLDGKARGVFQGKIIVAKDAQKTDAKMLNKTLLLSDHAEIDTKPELEIYADDVKCAHGATVGEIEQDALFYLRARGIGEEAARRMLVEAFLQEIVDEIDYRPAEILLHAQVSSWVESRKLETSEEKGE